MEIYQNVYTSNGAAILLLVMLLFSSRRTLRRRSMDDRLYYTMIASALLQSAVEMLTFAVDGVAGRGMHVLSVCANSFLFINNIWFSFVWAMYADYKIFEDARRLKRIYPLVALPALMVTAGVVVNAFVPLFFTVTAENVYQRGQWFAVPYLFTYFYLAYGVVLIYKYKNTVQKYLFLPALLFMLPIVITSVVQYLYYGVSIVWMGVSIALVSLYINVQNEVSYIDPLSGLFNRVYMSECLYRETRKLSDDKKLAAIMLDIDRFKSINDSYGHQMGDEAISAAGRILRSSMQDNAIGVRFAGDEFMVIMHVHNEAEVVCMIESIRENTRHFNKESKKPYQISFSLGYSVYERNGDTIDKFLGRIDQAMYVNKKEKFQSHALPDRRE